MKNILIIYPHWPPSNLAGVHRARLISNFLHQFNWHPIILTVSSEYYEEKLDYDLIKTVSSKTEVIYTKSYKVSKRFRVIGDIGLRSFPFIHKKALEILEEREIDFVWIPIPSFYMSLIGNLLFKRTGTPFGIDYIDPWVRPLALHENWLSRAGLSKKIAEFLEPMALRNVSLVSGVSEEYYLPALKRNNLLNKIQHVAMPYGFDISDHEVELSNIVLPWKKDEKVKHFVYAGAFLPKSHFFLQALFKVLKKLVENKGITKDFRFYFIGTGTYGGKQILDYAKEYDLIGFVHELNDRRPFLEVLNVLSESDGVLVLGSTEPHYTASKIFQSVLSKKPVFSIFHKESSVVEILKSAEAIDYSVFYDPNEDVTDFKERLFRCVKDFVELKKEWNPKYENLNQFSAKESAKKLVSNIVKII